jgi:hypothetical protein
MNRDVILNNKEKNIETAFRVNWQNLQTWEFFPDRVYIGHETCENLLPPKETALDAIKYYTNLDCKVTLVTPFLTPAGIAKAIPCIEYLSAFIESLEVVCSDWGLLDFLSQKKIGQPVVGRLLAGQSLDPRIAHMFNTNEHGNYKRILTHLDRTKCELQYELITEELKLHYQASAINKTGVPEYLTEMGISRYELNNIPQGISLLSNKIKYSLYYPDVLISLMRQCPGGGENFNNHKKCSHPCNENEKVTWHNDSMPYQFFRLNNGLYYNQTKLPENLQSISVDRIVY